MPSSRAHEAARPESDRPEAPRGIPREQDAPRSLILLLITGMLLAVAGLFYWIQASGMAGEVMNRPATFGREGPITELDEIFQESEKANLLGRDVALFGVPVERVVGDYVFWLGPDARRRVAVALLGERTGRQTEGRTEVRAGDRLAVFGRVRSIEEVRMLDEAWAIEPQEAQDLAGQAIYISAVRVEHLGRGGGGPPSPRPDG